MKDSKTQWIVLGIWALTLTSICQWNPIFPQSVFLHLCNYTTLGAFGNTSQGKLLKLWFTHSFLVTLTFVIRCFMTYQIQRIQNMAAKLIFRQQKFSHLSLLLIELHWL